MTVAELIKKLEAMPDQNALVVWPLHSGMSADFAEGVTEFRIFEKDLEHYQKPFSHRVNIFPKEHSCLTGRLVLPVVAII